MNNRYVERKGGVPENPALGKFLQLRSDATEQGCDDNRGKEATQAREIQRVCPPVHCPPAIANLIGDGPIRSV